MTTKRDHIGEDHSCVLREGEHPFIIHDSIVYYAQAYTTDEAAFRAVISQGHVEFLEPVAKGIVKKIQNGALTSRFTPIKIKSAVRVELKSE